jgi:hypothetical protein
MVRADVPHVRAPGAGVQEVRMTTPKQRRGPRIHLDDVEHFLGFGWSIERIAARLGVQVDSIQQAQRREARRQAEQSHPAQAEAA